MSLGITARHEVAIWGASVAGIGGRHDAIALATPQLLPGLAGTRSVIAGEFLRVPGLERVRAIAAGETHAAALTADALLGWGSNATGQIGTAEIKQLRPVP